MADRVPGEPSKEVADRFARQVDETAAEALRALTGLHFFRPADGSQAFEARSMIVTLLGGRHCLRESRSYDSPRGQEKRTFDLLEVAVDRGLRPEDAIWNEASFYVDRHHRDESRRKLAVELLFNRQAFDLLKREKAKVVTAREKDEDTKRADLIAAEKRAAFRSL